MYDFKTDKRKMSLLVITHPMKTINPDFKKCAQTPVVHVRRTPVRRFLLRDRAEEELGSLGFQATSCPEALGLRD